jgi:hypothetical protein
MIVGIAAAEFFEGVDVIAEKLAANAFGLESEPFNLFVTAYKLNSVIEVFK